MQNAENLFGIGFLIGGIALVFSLLQLRRVLRLPGGEEEAHQEVRLTLRRALRSYELRQYGFVLLCLGALFGLLWWMTSAGLLDNVYLPYAFLSGGLLSALTGLLGLLLWRDSVFRTAAALREELDKSLLVSFSAGSVIAFAVTGLTLLEVTGWIWYLKEHVGYDAVRIAEAVWGADLGAAVTALLTRLTGSIFAQAAQLAGGPSEESGAVGAAELASSAAQSIPGSTAGTYAGCLCALWAALALGGVVFAEDKLSWSAMLLPLVVVSVGVLTSIMGALLVRTRTDHPDARPVLGAFTRAQLCAALLTLAVTLPTVFFLMGSWIYCLPVLIGLVTGAGLTWTAEFSIGRARRSVQKLSGPAEGDLSASLLGGLSLGMRSTALPLLLLAVAAAASFLLPAGRATITDDGLARGAYGIALMTAGVFSVGSIPLCAALSGAVADGARGLVPLLSPDDGMTLRAQVLYGAGDMLSAGNKVRSAGEAALTALALLLSLPVLSADGAALPTLSLILGLLLGILLVFLVVSLTVAAVQRAGRSLSREIRRQTREVKTGGLDRPDGAKCASVCAGAALWESLLPALAGLSAPVLTRLLLGRGGMVGLLAGVLTAGLALSLTLSNAGSAWRSLRRQLLSEPHADPGSDRARALAASDRIGGPLGEAAGPALAALVLLCAALTVVLLGPASLGSLLS